MMAFYKSFVFSLLMVLSVAGNSQAFDIGSLNFNGKGSISSGTSLKFGPDGRLYVSEVSGSIKVFSISRNGPADYQVDEAITLSDVKNIPNHNDLGVSVSNNKRQVTGIEVTGTATNPVIYISSSDPKIGGPNGDFNLDTNSGVISRLSWVGDDIHDTDGYWKVVDIVRGLPRSEENHATNDLEFINLNGTDYLIVTAGGFTNAGSPSKNFTYITEFALSAAVLSVNLSQLESLPVLTDAASGRDYIYDLPTLDDPSRPNANGIADPNVPGYNGVDLRDPWGGNDGLNQAKLVLGGPVQIFTPGYRNTYAFVITESGALYVTDNGANEGWGGFPENEANPTTITNNYRQGEPGSSSDDADGEMVDNDDHIDFVTGDILSYIPGSVYGGHPHPVRANPGVPYTLGAEFPYSPGGAGLFTVPGSTLNSDPTVHFRTQILDPSDSDFATRSLPVDWPPVPLELANPDEADWRGANPNNHFDGQGDISITMWGNNSNAIEEYTASNFGGSMKGNLIGGRSTGHLHRLILNPDGSLNKLEQNKWNTGGNALGLTCNGDSQIFPGTIWVATFNNQIKVLEPNDFVVCVGPDDPNYDASADNDSDGFSNEDEVANGTDPCSGASRPGDYDGDKLSNLIDLDDDGDGIDDDLDPFQIGSPEAMPIVNELFSNQLDAEGKEKGYLGLGFTGLMNNGAPNPNYLDWFDRTDEGPNPNDVLGGAIGAITVNMTGGTARGTSNDQEKGYQFGVDVSTATGSFLVESQMINFQENYQLYQYAGEGELGIFIGDGTQSDYVSLVLTKEGAVFSSEANDTQAATPLTHSILEADRPEGEGVVFQILVDPATAVLRGRVIIGDEPYIELGTLVAEGTLLQALQSPSKPLAVGIYGTANDPAFSQEVQGTWDYFKVLATQPFILNELEDVEVLVDASDIVIDLGQYFEDDGGKSNLTYSVEGNSDPSIEAIINGADLSLSFPSSAANAVITIRATDLDLNYVEQQMLVSVIDKLPCALPAPWQDQDIGNTGTTGELCYEDDILSITASGADIWNNSDEFHYVYQTLTCDGSIVAKIESLENSNAWAKAGLMMRASVDANAQHAFMASTPENGLVFQNRSTTGGGSSTTGISGSAPKYLRMERTGNQFQGSVSEDGSNWTVVGTTIIAMDAEILVGMAVTSHNDGTNTTAICSEIEVVDCNSGQEPQPILVTAIPDQTSIEGAEPPAALTVIANGGDGNLNYAASGLPAGVQLEPTNGDFYGNINLGAAAGSPYQVVVTVDDGDEETSDAQSVSFEWTIQSSADIWIDLDENEAYTARHECSFVQAGQEFIAFGGRENAKTPDRYDFTTDTWTQGTQAPLEFNHFQAIEYQGLIWVIGAFKTNTFPNEVPAESIYMYDPAADVWIEGPEIPESRRRGSAGLVLYNDKFYVIAGNKVGHNGGYYEAWFDEFDPATGEWTVLEDAPHRRDHFFAAVHGDKLYALGGRLSGNNSELGIGGGTFGPLVAEVDVFDFTTQTWSTLPSAQNLPTPRAAAPVAVLHDEIFVMGGEVPDLNNAYKIVEAYDPVSQTWSEKASMNYARHGTQAIVSGESIVVALGSPSRGGGKQKNAEAYGSYEPVGVPIVPGNLQSPASLAIEAGSSQTLTLANTVGNQGIYISNISISGANAGDFELSSEQNKYLLIPVGGSLTLPIAYTNASAPGTASLMIDYRGGLQKTIQLSGLYDDPVNLAPEITLAGVTNLTLPTSGYDPGAIVTDDGLPSPQNLTYTWTLQQGNSANVTMATPNELHPQISIDQAGSYVFRLEVSDGELNTFAMQEVLTEVAPPQPDFALRLNGGGPAYTALNGDVFIADAAYISSGNVKTYSNSSLSQIANTEDDELYLTERAMNINNGSFSYAVTVPAGTYTVRLHFAEIYWGASGGGGGGTGSRVFDVLAEGDLKHDNLDVYQQASGAATALVTEFEVMVTDGVLDLLFSALAADGGVNQPKISALEILSHSIPNQDPTAMVLATPTSGFAPLEVQFNASGSNDPDGDIISYSWSFGDSSNSSTSGEEDNTRFVYTEPGLYTAVLTVEDDIGATDETEVEILVEAAPPVNLAPVVDAGTNATLQLPVVSYNPGASASDDGLPVDNLSLSWTVTGGNPSNVSFGNAFALDPEISISAPGVYTLQLSGSDTEFTSTSELVLTVEEAPLEEGVLAESAVIPEVGTDWVSVNLTQTYSSPVIIATANLPIAGAKPVVTRLRNVTSNGFEIRLQNPGDGSLEDSYPVHYLVVNEGTYTEAEHGVTFEAKRTTSDLTANDDNWTNEAQSYSNSYDQPVVLGQVMSFNDPDWSVFWASDGSQNKVPTNNKLGLGKHVGEDGDETRADETIGYIVLESGAGILGGIAFEAGVGEEIVRGPENISELASYGFSASAVPDAGVAILSPSGMKGTHGGWPVLYGATPVGPNSFTLVVDEDQVNDSERSHTYERVAYAVFSVGGPAEFDPVALIDADPHDGILPFEVSFDGSSSYDPDGGDIVGFSWDFGDGSPTTTGTIARHTYSALGTFTATLTVTDDENATAQTTVQITVTDGVIPEYTLTLTDDGNGTASVYPSETIFEERTPVTVTATPSEGFSFLAWEDGRGGTISTQNPYSFPIEEDLELVATFTDACTSIAVTKLQLINAITDEVILDNIPDGFVLDKVFYNDFNIVAVTQNCEGKIVRSVRFTRNGRNYQTESTAPWAMGGDDNGDYKSMSLALGEQFIRATPYTGKSAKGAVGQALSVQITVVSNTLAAKGDKEDGPGIKPGLDAQLMGDAKVEGARFELEQNYPNPVAGQTTIEFYLPEAGEATLLFFSIDGRLLKRLEGDFEAGSNQVSIQRTDLSTNGSVFYHLIFNDRRISRQMILHR